MVKKTSSPPRPASSGRAVPVVAVLFAAALLASCAGLGPAEKTSPGKAEAPGPGEGPSVTAERRTVTGDKLESPAFAALPPEAGAYLKALSAAFRSGNKKFLLAQGEARFEAGVKPHYDDEVYLALLYRIGPYAADSPWQNPVLPRLEPDKIGGIEYTDWREQGPMLEIRGRLLVKNGKPIPCRIVLVWKLAEPKILGEFP